MTEQPDMACSACAHVPGDDLPRPQYGDDCYLECGGDYVRYAPYELTRLAPITLWGRIPLSMNEREGYLSRPGKPLTFILMREKKEIMAEIEHAALEAAWTSAEGKRRHVQITVQKGPRAKRDDPANRDSRAKATLDALKKLGYIVDDSDEWIEWHPLLETQGSEKATIIELWDAVI